MNIYSIKDKGMGFTQTFTATNDYAALRNFVDTVNAQDAQGKPATIIGQHPGDFSLFKLGELDQDTGTIKPEVKFLEEATVLKKATK